MDVKQSNHQKHCGQNDFQINESNEQQKIPYPKQVFFIIGTEFCERFTYFGMSTILVLYLNEKLGYSEDDSTVLFHGFITLVYLLCIPGGIISDVWLGKFNTIFYISFVYVAGCVSVSLSAIPNIGISPKIALIIGLVLIAIGTGGIKSSVCAFGGDQFKLPEQAVQLAAYFSLFYFSISLGSVVSTTLTPILRSDVHCFGENDCYALAFGVPAVLMVVAIAFFLSGKSSYAIVNVSSQNMIIQATKCISNAITTKFREGRRSPRKNLLDYSIEKYGEQLVEDVRALLRILVLYLPLPMFWAISAQSGPWWTFQAKQMNGDIGFYHLKPDQMSMISSVLLLTLIPIFETVVYPLLTRFGLRRPLQKMAIGGMISAISIVIAGLVQLQIEASPKNTVHMLWQLPQNFVSTVGDIMFQVIGLDFSYQEAPKSLKTVILSFWLLAMSLGNLIWIFFVSSGHLFQNRSHEFLFLAGLMFVVVTIFSVLAYFYKSTNRSEKKPSA